MGMDTNTILFFDKHPDAMPLYEAFADAVTKLYPDVRSGSRNLRYHFMMYICLPVCRSLG